MVFFTILIVLLFVCTFVGMVAEFILFIKEAYFE